MQETIPFSEINTCPECSKSIDLDSHVCRNCGLAIDDNPIFDYSIPRRAYTPEKRKQLSQNGKAITIFDVDLSRMTGIYPTEAQNPKYNGFSRIAKIDKFKHDYKTKNLHYYGKELKIIAQKLNVPYNLQEQ